MEKDSQIKEIPSTKKCSKCNIYQPIICFHKSSKNKDGHNYWCKDCMKDYRRPSEDPESKKVYHRQHLYGLSAEDYHKLLMDQSECCAICFEHISTFKRDLYVDHNHETGTVRGLLCSKCNSGIGYLGDNLSNLRSAVEYLETRGSYG